jgi:hypothetical protein
MRNFASSTGRRSPFGPQALWLVLITLLLAIGGYLGRAPLSAALTPVFGKSAGTSAQLGRFIRGIGERSASLEALVAENADLKQKLEASQTLVLDRNQLYEENTALKEQWGRSSEPNRLLATVLARPGATPYDTLMVDVGSSEGVRDGDSVAAGGTLLIGRVSQVFAHSAVVLLYSSPGESYDGFLRGTIPIKVVGQGAGSLSAEVPYDAKVVAGDSITLPLLQANTAFIVEHVEVGEGNSSTKAYLRLPVSPFNLRFVEVWRQTQ